MIISIASGKGGTGKTTVATNLAISLSQMDVTLLDCDVEEPNAHLFLMPQMESKESVTTPVPQIDEGKCTLCGKCSEICQFKAIVRIADTMLTFTDLCHSCGGCMKVCPSGAISETGRELGVIEKGFKNGIKFIHGRLRVGEAMSPPLIKQVRKMAGNSGLTIIDAPPGTSCPVISAMKDTDFVILVTEPTPFGLNDLKLAVGAVKILGIPCGLIINRSDMGDDRVQGFAADEGIPILMEIPFDRKIAESYSKGELIVESIPEYKKKFIDLYDNILKIVAAGGTN
ncbi:MAG: P-loop NTPase [Desulfatiglans sp.]|nr:P-loop NTPase [Desulfatiglans sp.]